MGPISWEVHASAVVEQGQLSSTTLSALFAVLRAKLAYLPTVLPAPHAILEHSSIRRVKLVRQPAQMVSTLIVPAEMVSAWVVLLLVNIAVQPHTARAASIQLCFWSTGRAWDVLPPV